MCIVIRLPAMGNGKSSWHCSIKHCYDNLLLCSITGPTDMIKSSWHCSIKHCYDNILLCSITGTLLIGGTARDTVPLNIVMISVCSAALQGRLIWSKARGTVPLNIVMIIFYSAALQDRLIGGKKRVEQNSLFLSELFIWHSPPHILHTRPPPRVN